MSFLPLSFDRYTAKENVVNIDHYMEETQYKYDVAFSFLKEDERLVSTINDLLQDRLSTFLYSKRQEELAGTDGEETFNQVFGSEARVVAVFYRQEWGKTPWTRIEETAIRNRAFDEGYDFTVFIPLDSPPAVPKWLPKTRIWVGLDRWGVKGAASVIESRVQESGGMPREETIEERAARLSREITREEERKRFLDSELGVEAADSNVENLFSEIKRTCEVIVDERVNLRFRFEENRHKLGVYSHIFSLVLYWHRKYANVLDESLLWVLFYQGYSNVDGTHYALEKPKLLTEWSFVFDLNEVGDHGWRQGGCKGEFFLTNQLAQKVLELLLLNIRKQRINT